MFPLLGLVLTAFAELAHLAGATVDLIPNLLVGFWFVLWHLLASLRRGIVSAKQSPAYQSMPEYERISERLEKLQVSFSKKPERMGYDGRRVGNEG